MTQAFEGEGKASISRSDGPHVHVHVHVTCCACACPCVTPLSAWPNSSHSLSRSCASDAISMAALSPRKTCTAHHTTAHHSTPQHSTPAQHTMQHSTITAPSQHHSWALHTATSVIGWASVWTRALCVVLLAIQSWPCVHTPPWPCMCTQMPWPSACTPPWSCMHTALALHAHRLGPACTPGASA